MEQSKRHITIVIMPLRTLISDQRHHITALGISCGVITRHEEMTTQDIAGIMLHTHKFIDQQQILSNIHLTIKTM